MIKVYFLLFMFYSMIQSCVEYYVNKLFYNKLQVENLLIKLLFRSFLLFLGRQ